MKPLLEMALSRESFRDKVQEKLAGAYVEFMKAAVFKANGQRKYVVHKTTEVKRLLGEFEVLQYVSTKGTWKVQKAATEAANSLFNKHRRNFLAMGENAMVRYFEKKSRPIETSEAEAWFAEFEGRVAKIISSFIVA